MYTIWIICEISRIGVDVEEIKEIPINDFNNLFADLEWEEVLHGENKFRAFYTLWTKKEAFLKLIGCVLNQPLHEVIIKNNKIVWENEAFFFDEIILDSQHIAYLCSDEVSPVIELQEIFL